MSQLVITDLNFFEAVHSEKTCLGGGVLASGNYTPSYSLAYDTAYDTKYATGYDVKGNQLNGFGVNLLSFGSAAGAAAGAASIGGTATADANAKA
jgi:hypothetical protein